MAERETAMVIPLISMPLPFPVSMIVTTRNQRILTSIADAPADSNECITIAA